MSPAPVGLVCIYSHLEEYFVIAMRIFIAC